MCTYSERDDPDGGDHAHTSPDKKVFPPADYASEGVVAEDQDAHFESPGIVVSMLTLIAAERCSPRRCEMEQM